MRKCICNIFARQLPPSPDVTSQTLIYAFTKLHVSCFGFVKDRIYGSWFGLIFFEVRRIIVQLNSLRSHFFTTLLLLNKFAGSCGFCEIRTCTDECFHFWSAVLLITSTNFKYVRIVYCLSDHLIWSSTALMRQHGGWKRVLRSVLGLLRVRVCCRMCSRTTDHTGKVLEQAIMFNYTLEHSFLLTWTKNVDDCFPLLSYITSGPPCFLKYAVFFFLLVCRECYLFRHCHQLNGNSSR